MRALRTDEYLYIRNLTPERGPTGDRPGPSWSPGDPTGGFGDIDGGPSKTLLWERRADYPVPARLAFSRRPAEELYWVTDDPDNLRNLAEDPAFQETRRSLAQRLDQYLERTLDPRATGRGEFFDGVFERYPSVAG